MSRLTTRRVRNAADVEDFFDEWADRYVEQHGPPERLRELRLNLIERLAQFRPSDVVLEIGCGTGAHLLALADKFNRGIGVDISAAMLRKAQKQLGSSPAADRIEFRLDQGEKLSSVPDHSVDVALLIGSLEHLLDAFACLLNVRRVLRETGRLVCLTPHGGFIWYRDLAPLLGVPTKHLTTDHFYTSKEVKSLLDHAGFNSVEITYWSFIPRGDVPPPLALLLSVLDRIGALSGWSYLRGGMAFVANRERREAVAPGA